MGERIFIGDILMELVSEPRQVKNDKFTAFAIDTRGRLFRLEWNVIEGDIVNDWDVPDNAHWISSNHYGKAIKLFNKLADTSQHLGCDF